MVSTIENEYFCLFSVALQKRSFAFSLGLCVAGNLASRDNAAISPEKTKDYGHGRPEQSLAKACKE